jgi:hypothetical protein
VTFTVDRTGPAVAPHATSASGVITLTATATDALSGIAAGEWYEGADPGIGFAKPLTVTATGATTATLSTTVPGLTNGTHTLYVRAKDSAGNWGSATATTVTVTGSSVIFANNFDAGPGAWSQRVGTVVVAPSAAFGNSPALTVTGRTPSYVADTSPTAERRLRAQFDFAAGTYNTNGAIVDLFQGRAGNGSAVTTVQYRRTGAGGSQLRVGVLGSSTWTYSAWYTVPATRVTVAVDWRSATAGSAVLTVNGTAAGTATGNTSARTIETAALGMIAATGATTGSAAIDNYTSTR